MQTLILDVVGQENRSQ